MLTIFRKANIKRRGVRRKGETRRWVGDKGWSEECSQLDTSETNQMRPTERRMSIRET